MVTTILKTLLKLNFFVKYVIRQTIPQKVIPVQNAICRLFGVIVCSSIGRQGAYKP